VALRPIRLLRDAWADAVGLRNDIVSFRKEVEAGEMPSNAVAVVQGPTSLGTSAARPANSRAPIVRTL
jgi:hypothetical protein